MNWYFDNDGAAEGPHDASAMAAFVGQGRITAHTLVWDTAMPAWKEAAVVAAPWWRGEIAEPAIDAADAAPTTTPAAAPPPRPPAETRRRPILTAPTGPLAPSPQPAAVAPRRGFFARLFGRP